MSLAYLVALTAVVVTVVLGLRRGIDVTPRSTPLEGWEAMFLTTGVLGLVFHCGAMFFRSTVVRIPGTAGAVGQVDAMAVASQIWFVVPAVLVLLGLRRQPIIACVAVALTLVGVGITMYDGGPLRVHLIAIFAAVAVLSGVVSLTLRPPTRQRPHRGPRPHLPAA